MDIRKLTDSPYAVVFYFASIGLIGVFIFILFGKKISSLLEPSVFHITYQFLLLAVLGGVISFQFKELSNKKQKREDKLLRDEEKRRFHNEKRRKIHSDLLTAFNQAKTVRRILKAFKYTTDDGIEIVLRDDYDRQMQELNIAQLMFETYSKRVKYNKLWFEKAENLSKNLEFVESYLNEIISEYEKKRSLFNGSTPSYPLSELPNLAEFIGPKKDWITFSTKFKTPMRETLRSLDEARLG